MFSEKVVEQTKDVLKGLKGKVRLTYFSQEMECEPCTSVSSFVDEMIAIDPRLEVEKKDFVGDGDLARELGIHHIPALVLHHPVDGRPAVRYYGLPGGYEFGAFLRTLVLFSSAGSPGDVVSAAAEIGEKTNLKVFVLTTCPSCPVMAYTANSFAFSSPSITTEIIEANTFMDLATRFTVGTVPKIVINDTREVVGVVGPAELKEKIQAP